MGFSDALDHLIGEIRDLTPTRDVFHNFVIDEDGSGRVIPLEARRDSVNARQCDLRIRQGFGPSDDGEAGRTSRRLRVGLVLRTLYPFAGDRGLAERMAAEDAGLLALELPVMAIGAAATTAGIVSIPPAGPAALEVLADDNGTEVALLLSLPFDMLYLEA